MKILLVEDEPKLASFIKKGLTSEGYDLLIAYDGQMGLSLAQQQPFDLIILDVNLPLLNGFELCRRIRADYPHVPIIFLTAFDSLEDKVLGMNGGWSSGYVAEESRACHEPGKRRCRPAGNSY